LHSPTGERAAFRRLAGVASSAQYTVKEPKVFDIWAAGGEDGKNKTAE
jgi:hypothetical protein